MLNSHRKNDILNAPRPPLFPLLFSHDLEVISISQSKCVVCQSVCKKCFKNPQRGKEELGEQEIIQLGPVYGSTDVQQPEEIIQFCPVNTISDVLEKHFTHNSN